MTKHVFDESLATRRTYILLQKALIDLMVLKPFEKITLIQLCEQAMIPRSTFYRYFEDKHDLLRYSIYQLFQELQVNDDVIYFQDVDSLRSFLLEIIRILNQDKDLYYRLYRMNKNGDLMGILKDFLTDILTVKLKESEAQGINMKISLQVFIYLLTDFYFSAAKGFLELSNLESVDRYVDDVCRFSDKDFFTL